MNKRRISIIAILFLIISSIVYAGINDRFADLELVDVTATADEINKLDGLSGDVITTTSTSELTNKTFEDSSVSFINDDDSTKTLFFELRGATTGADLEIYSAQSADGSLTIPNLAGVSATLATQAYVAALADKVIYLTATLTDLSTASAQYVVSPIAGDVTSIKTVIETALASADGNLQFQILDTAMTASGDGSLVIAYSGSAAGDIDTFTPTALNTLTAGQAIEIYSDGASTNACETTVTFTITP